MGLLCSQIDPSNDGETTENNKSSKDDNDDSPKAAYDAWMMKHPSALNKFDKMMANAKEEKIVVFLDYDGTLSPIVDDPDQAFMSDSMRSALNEVAQQFPTCIVSGRRREKVYEFVRLANVYYIGSHGMDIMAPIKSSKDVNIAFHERENELKGNENVIFQPAQEFLPIIEEVYKELEERTKDIDGVMVEDNKFCVSVHFRRVDEEDWDGLEERVISISEKFPTLFLTKGRKVIEIRPSIEWDKGRALEYILDALGFGSCCDALPLYIGDDRTDEDAFQAPTHNLPFISFVLYSSLSCPYDIHIRTNAGLRLCHVTVRCCEAEAKGIRLLYLRYLKLQKLSILCVIHRKSSRFFCGWPGGEEIL